MTLVVDQQGRLPLRRAALAISWRPLLTVELTVADDLLRLTQSADEATGSSGVVAVLDRRFRMQVPFGVRELTELTPGSAAVAVTSSDGGLVVVPASRLVARIVS